MLDQSKELLKTVLRSIVNTDPSVTDDMAKNCMMIFSGVPSGNGSVDSDMRILTRKEAAGLLGISPRRLDDYTSTGRLKRFYMPGAQRALGIRARELNELINSGVR